jgi:hypothetical protein
LFCLRKLPFLLQYTGFPLVAADAWGDVDFGDDDDDAVSFASFGDFCDAVMPDSWIAANWKEKKQAMRNEAIQNWLVGC